MPPPPPSLSKVEDLEDRLESEAGKMAAIKSEHLKQHKMDKKQIHDLRDKLSRSEVCDPQRLVTVCAFVFFDVQC